MEKQERLSRTELKRQSHVMEDLASELANLRNKDIAELPVDDELRQEIDRTARMMGHGARKRQIKFLAKCLRNASSDDMDVLMTHMSAFHQSRVQSVERDKEIERLWGRLMDLDTRAEAFEEVESRFPSMDLVGLRVVLERCSQWAPPRFSKEVLRRLRLAASR